MRLQLSVDLLSLDDALELARKTAPYVDVIEAGTPLIKQVGLQSVEAFKKNFPDKLVYADMKTMDAGALEAKMAFEAGADFVTVLAFSADATITGALESARKYGSKVVADMIRVHDRGKRAQELEKLGVDMIALHHGLDEQALGMTSLAEFSRIKGHTKLPFLIEGGINATSIVEAKNAGAAQVAVGHFIYADPNPGEVAKRLRELIG